LIPFNTELPMQIAITRQVSPAIANCELTYLDRVEIDYALACRQHEQYCQALAGLGCQVLSLPAQADLPDSVFVEDAALVLDETAILTRPGAASRRPEVDLIRPVLAEYRPLRPIQAPGTLEGGDILQVGRIIYVGLSGRSSPAGIAQLADLVTPYGYTVQAVPLTGCLHLKSAVSRAAPDTLLINPHWVDPARFAAFRLLDVDPAEPHAANALLLDRGVIYPSAFPLTLRRLEQSGIPVTIVDVSELQKAEGAVTCCSLVFAWPAL
jgi:dimethylargininase